MEGKRDIRDILRRKEKTPDPFDWKITLLAGLVGLAWVVNIVAIIILLIR